MKFDIWTEGFLDTGMEGIPAKANLVVSNIEADTFIEACKKYYKGNPSFNIIDGIPVYWGCRLFDNEKDARKSFG